MGWRDKWYPDVITAMRGVRGDGMAGPDGVTMPLLQASDGVSMLGMISPGLIAALTRNSQQNGDKKGLAIESDLTDGDGVVDVFEDLSNTDEKLNPGSYIPIADYVAGIGSPGDTARRSKTMGGELYSIFVFHNAITGDEMELLAFCRQAVRSWQRAVDAAAVMLASAIHASDTSNALAVGTFLSAIRSLCADLDVLAENPPMTTADKIRGAARAALTATEQFAGKAAAQLSEEVGKLAGNVASGFFSQAGVTSLVVAGLAVYLFLK